MSQQLVVAFVSDLSPRAAARPRSSRFDRDDLESLLSKWSPSVELGQLGAATFRSLEDFTPDVLVDRLPALEAWRAAAEEAGSPERAKKILEAAGERWPAKAASSEKEPSAPQTVTESELLDSILGGDGGEEPVRVGPKGTGDEVFDRAIDAIIGDTGVPPESLDTKKRRELFLTILAARLRDVLHRPAFEHVESAWRGLFNVTRTVPTSAGVVMHVVDAGADDARVLEALQAIDAMPGSDALRVVFLDRRFEDRPEDRSVLERWNDWARGRATTVIAAAGESLVAATRSPEWQESWQTFESVALTWPRALTRLPYGANSEPVDVCPLEEIEGSEGYTWQSPIYLVARILLGGYCARLTDPDQTVEAVLEGLPLHARTADSDPPIVGPLEHLVTADEVTRLADAGLLPLAGFVNQDRVALAALRTLGGRPLFG
ncbi:MAG: type VI secretion system contractile sheath large subunit [Planctomycetota bacterium]